jgi:Flp pilus assembly protein TadG
MSADPAANAVARVRRPSDRGAVTTEMVITMPILVAFLFLVIAAGRLTDAKSDVVGVANDAARVASLQDTAGAARAEAEAAAADSVSGERLNCQGGGPQVRTDFDPAFERGASVHVVVTCTVNTQDLTFIGLPISVTLTEEAWEPIDEFASL